MNKIDLITQAIIKFQDNDKSKLKIKLNDGTIIFEENKIMTDTIKDSDELLSTNIFLVSPESGTDIKIGDIFLTVPDYDTFYICTNINKEKINGFQINHITGNEFFVYDNVHEFKTYNARKIIASGDATPFDIPVLTDESINEIVQNYNDTNEPIYHITFNVDDDGMNVQTNDDGKVELIKKTEEEKETEQCALKFWDTHIKPKFEKQNTCSSIKLLAAFIQSYIENKEMIEGTFKNDSDGEK